MSAERSTESMIDLIYGELPEDEAREVRAELGTEVDELDGLLGRIREAMPREDVPGAIHASILEAARSAAANGTADGSDRLMRRPPTQQQSFWRRIGRTQGSQLALVAAVLIAGLFVVRAVERQENPMRVAPSSLSSMQEAAPTAAMQAPAKAEQESADSVEGGAAIADQWTPGADAPPPPAEALLDEKAVATPAPDPVETTREQKPADEAAADSLRQELARTRSLDLSKEEARRDIVSDKRTEPAPERKAVATTSTRPSSTPAPKPAQKAKSGNIDALLAGEDQQSQGSLGRGTGANEGAFGVKAEPEADAPTMPAAAEPAAEKPAEYRAPANSIDAVNQYFRAGDYGGAIRAADEFLAGNSRASATEKATAMHVKAQSLEKQGKYTEADRIYVAIQKNYPAYSPGQINNAREEIRRKNAPKPTKKARSKADSEKSYDFDDSAVSY